MDLQYLDTIIAFVVILLAVSLLITILTQMIASLFGLRGTNLLWGVRTLLAAASPELTAEAENLAKKVLTDPTLSDSIFSRFTKGSPTRWKLASAVSPESLTRTLRKLADEYSDASKSGKTIEGKNYTYGKVATDIYNLLDAVDPEATRKARALESVFKDMAPGYAVQVDKIVQQLGTTVNTSIGKLDAWFNIIIKRTSQRFAMHARLWTVTFALLIAFFAHLDAFKIWNQLWMNPVLRTKLVQVTPDLLKESSAVLPSGTAQGQGLMPSSPQLLADAMNKLMEKEKQAFHDLKQPPFGSLDDAVKWLNTNDKLDQKDRERLVEEYKVFVLSEQADRVRQQLLGTGFKLIPTPYCPFSFDGLQNVLGILIFGGFLSLGAPFWFNTLKNLANLRSMVSILNEQEKA